MAFVYPMVLFSGFSARSIRNALARSYSRVSTCEIAFPGSVSCRSPYTKANPIYTFFQLCFISISKSILDGGNPKPARFLLQFFDIWLDPPVQCASIPDCMPVILQFIHQPWLHELLYGAYQFLGKIHLGIQWFV